MTAAATLPTLNDAVLNAALTGLNVKGQKSLPPWLFYDDIGSALFEQITALPEYYLTRTERALFTEYAHEIVTALGCDVTFAELGAGSASKTGILLRAAAAVQPNVLYQPIDISPSALDEAAASIALHIPGVTIVPQVANYITERYTITRSAHNKVMALYIGSSIGNFSPAEGRSILCNLRQHLAPGDALLLGTDLAPAFDGSSSHKTVETLLAAYDDASGTTAAFNKNVLHRLNRELAADFNLDTFAHRARWNARESRIEMHLESLAPQTVRLAGHEIPFAAHETIHTENSYKFTTPALTSLLADAHFTPSRTFTDPAHTFAVTLATAA